MKEVFEYASNGRISSRSKLHQTFQTSIEQKGLSYIVPLVWNKLPSSMKRNTSLNLN